MSDQTKVEVRERGMSVWERAFLVLLLGVFLRACHEDVPPGEAAGRSAREIVDGFNRGFNPAPSVPQQKERE